MFQSFTEVTAELNRDIRRHIPMEIDELLEQVEQTGVSIKLTRKRYMLTGSLDQICAAQAIIDEAVQDEPLHPDPLSHSMSSYSSEASFELLRNHGRQEKGYRRGFNSRKANIETSTYFAEESVSQQYQGVSSMSGPYYSSLFNDQQEKAPLRITSETTFDPIPGTLEDKSLPLALSPCTMEGKCLVSGDHVDNVLHAPTSKQNSKNSRTLGKQEEGQSKDDTLCENQQALSMQPERCSPVDPVSLYSERSGTASAAEQQNSFRPSSPLSIPHSGESLEEVDDQFDSTVADLPADPLGSSGSDVTCGSQTSMAESFLGSSETSHSGSATNGKAGLSLSPSGPTCVSHASRTCDIPDVVGVLSHSDDPATSLKATEGQDSINIIPPTSTNRNQDDVIEEAAKSKAKQNDKSCELLLDPDLWEYMQTILAYDLKEIRQKHHVAFKTADNGSVAAVATCIVIGTAPNANVEMAHEELKEMYATTYETCAAEMCRSTGYIDNETLQVAVKQTKGMFANLLIKISETDRGVTFIGECDLAKEGRMTFEKLAGIHRGTTAGRHWDNRDNYDNHSVNYGFHEQYLSLSDDEGDYLQNQSGMKTRGGSTSETNEIGNSVAQIIPDTNLSPVGFNAGGLNYESKNILQPDVDATEEVGTKGSSEEYENNTYGSDMGCEVPSDASVKRMSADSKLSLKTMATDTVGLLGESPRDIAVDSWMPKSSELEGNVTQGQGEIKGSGVSASHDAPQWNTSDATTALPAKKEISGMTNGLLTKVYDATTQPDMAEQPRMAETNNGPSCLLCSRIFTRLIERKVLPCGDIFCPRCIDNFFQEQSHCPRCRRDYNGETFIQPPSGNLAVKMDKKEDLPGFDNQGTLLMTFEFAGGRQQVIIYLFSATSALLIC